MRCPSTRCCVLVPVSLGLFLAIPQAVSAQVRAWEGTVTIPTYPWESDVNPKFWALEHGTPGWLVYPYTMEDRLSRRKADRTYRALFLENQYLKVTCLPELGGRFHSVLDRTEGKEMFYLNRVIKPSMIALRGAWVSGGVEWNAGPQSHTVTCVSPVDAVIGHNADGSAYVEVGNLERSLRTRWTVRVTLHPGRAYLDERIRIFNPTDGLNPYYFWNCTAFPNRPGTRFIFPMTLGTDHGGSRFFTWPSHEGRDLTWLKNYEESTSIFAVDCTFDFFGAYDVDRDRGIVQAADHTQLGGKKAWTWGTWDFGLVCQENLTDEDGPYIEVQSGPLPTQSDYGALWPRDGVSWQEWWYPVHGLGDGFEFATKDAAVQTTREGGGLQVRILATGAFPAARCTISNVDRNLLVRQVDLSPAAPQVVELSPVPPLPVRITIRAAGGDVLASYVSPLPIPRIEPPVPSASPVAAEAPVQERYLAGRKADLAMNRAGARQHYKVALAEDAGHGPTLRALAVLDIESGLYGEAVRKLEQALMRDATDGLSWYFMGVGHLKLGRDRDALRCGRRAARCRETAALGHDLAGRVLMRMKQYDKAADAFGRAVRFNPNDTKAQDHLLLAWYAGGDTERAWGQAGFRLEKHPTELIPRAVLALRGAGDMHRFVKEVRSFVGEVAFEMLETCLVFADVGLVEEATRLLAAVCVEAVPETGRSPLPLYYLAWFASLQGDEQGAQAYLAQAARASKDLVFPSRPEAVDAFKCAIRLAPGDARAHLHLGNLYGHLGRLGEAVSHWQKAAELDASLSIAFRNLGLHSRVVEKDLAKAAGFYVKAVAARPEDQTLYRDLAEIFAADGRRGEAIGLLESMPVSGQPRADILLTLARVYLDEKQYTDAIDLLESTPYFVNWEGDRLPWILFNRARLQRGQRHFEQGRLAAALQDFEAAMTYPENLGVGRSNKPEHAPAHYWRGKALEAMGRPDEARAAWHRGAAGHEGSGKQNEYRQKCRDALPAETPPTVQPQPGGERVTITAPCWPARRSARQGP